MLPNLLVIGAPKAGTTSLFSYLGRHPDICPSKTKEVGFFLRLRRGEGLDSAEQTYREEFRQYAGQRYRLEATPAYCYAGEPVIKGIQGLLKGPRIILSLREPIERLWSAYTFQRSKGKLGNVRDFETYLAVCRERYRQKGDWKGDAGFSGLLIGFYGEYVPHWLEAFGDD